MFGGMYWSEISMIKASVFIPLDSVLMQSKFSSGQRIKAKVQMFTKEEWATFSLLI